MSGRTKDSVQIDKYALNNVLLANETTAMEVSQMMGHSKNYLSQIACSGGWIKRKDFENLKGLLRITDTDIIKAVPVQRHEEVESIYQPLPVKKPKNVFTLDEENDAFIGMIAAFGGDEKAVIVNAIITEYRTNSELAAMLAAVTDTIKNLTK